jgi:hypothetical protein
MEQQYSRIEELDQKIRSLRNSVLRATEFDTVNVLNVYISGKLQDYLDVLHRTYKNSDEFIATWFRGFGEDIKSIMLIEKDQRKEKDLRRLRLFDAMKLNRDVVDFVKYTLERSFLRKNEKYSRNKPPESDILWIGDNSRIFGIGIFIQADRYPIYDGIRFTGKYRIKWSNDRSETFKLAANYWTIGHILRSGMIDYNNSQIIYFKTVKEYLDFFLDFVIRQSSYSDFETQIAKCYCEYAEKSNDPLELPLLIPQFRYGGLEHKHKYRLDFMIIDPFTHTKYGIEISPFSTHGQKDVYQHDIDKQNDFVNKYNIVPIKYADHHLQDVKSLFLECIVPYLSPKDMNETSANDAIADLLSLKE